VASQALTTLVGISVFLAYGTTAAVARQLGAGHREAAIRQGIDGLWLAGIIGAVVLAAGWPLAPQIVHAFGGSPGVSGEAGTYLRISLLGAPAMLAVLAGTGVLRGLQVPSLFSAAPAVRRLLPAVLLVAAAQQPVAGVVFVLDGVLIGAGDRTTWRWPGWRPRPCSRPARCWSSRSTRAWSRCGWRSASGWWPVSARLPCGPGPRSGSSRARSAASRGARHRRGPPQGPR
jgi:Na+-driven multidrug efflux pump